jgi:hypothetical protein
MKSDVVKKGIERAPHRSLLRALGCTDKELGQPFVGVVNSFSEIVPGHMHLRSIAEAVKSGVRQAGGVPFEVNTIAVCDGIAMNHPGMVQPAQPRANSRFSGDRGSGACLRCFGVHPQLRQGDSGHAHGGRAAQCPGHLC